MAANQPPRTATMWNNNGGGGKTTCAVNGGAALGRDGDRVLVMDLDPQEGNLTDHMGFGHLLDDDYYDVSEILVDPTVEKGLDDLILDKDEHGLEFDLLPSHSELDDFDTKVALQVQSNQMTLLRWAMKDAGLFDAYDTIIIDVQASKGLLVKNCLVATQNVIVPVELSRKGVQSVRGLEKFIAKQQRDLARDEIELQFGIAGVIPNRTRNPLSTEQRLHLQELEEGGKPVTPFVLHDQTMVSEAWGNRMSVFEYTEQEDYRVRERHRKTLAHFREIGKLIKTGTVDELTSYEEAGGEEVLVDV